MIPNLLNQVIKCDPFSWLLEPDIKNPGVRYFALMDLEGLQQDHPDVILAQENVMKTGPVPVILMAQNPEGYWEKEGSGYYPKYQGSVWQIIMLAKLGANGSDPRIKKGCEYLLENALSPYGGFSADQRPSGMIQCLQGNLCAAMIDLGFYADERLQGALNWLARSITGSGIASAENREAPVRFYRSGNSAPGFACSANNHLPCAWGAVKAMHALSKIPQNDRTEIIEEAINTGTDFLLSRDPAQADYPMGYNEKPNRSWFKFGFQIGYVTDVLEILEVLTASDFSKDSRLEHAVELLINKKDDQDRWRMEYTYNGKTWVDIEKKGFPSKWVTLRALRVLERYYQ